MRHHWPAVTTGALATTCGVIIGHGERGGACGGGAGEARGGGLRAAKGLVPAHVREGDVGREVCARMHVPTCAPEHVPRWVARHTGWRGESVMGQGTHPLVLESVLSVPGKPAFLTVVFMSVFVKKSDHGKKM